MERVGSVRPPPECLSCGHSTTPQNVEGPGQSRWIESSILPCRCVPQLRARPDIRSRARPRYPSHDVPGPARPPRIAHAAGHKHRRTCIGARGRGTVGAAMHQPLGADASLPVFSAGIAERHHSLTPSLTRTRATNSVSPRGCSRRPFETGPPTAEYLRGRGASTSTETPPTAASSGIPFA